MATPGSTQRAPRLRHERIWRAYDQAGLARRAGISRGTVARIERGEPATLPTIRKLAQALGVEPAALMEPNGAAYAARSSRASPHPPRH